MGWGSRHHAPPLIKPRQVKVALGYPYGGGVTGPFLESMLRLQLHALSKPEPILQYRLPQAGLYIEHNRNRIVEKFMETDGDWLLQIDSDIEFPPDLVETMLRLAGTDKKILAASVPLGPPLPSSAWMLTETPGVWAGLPADRVTAEGIACDGLATAVMLVHREVFQAIADREGQCWFLKLPAVPRMDDPRSEAAWTPDGRVADRRYIPQGEDLSFCLRAKDAGYTSWCVKIPGLRHHKTLPLSHDYEVSPEEVPEAVVQGGGA